MDAPSDRCGYTFDAGAVTEGDGCCWRHAWRDADRCVWHADVAEKPVDELAAARADGPERLDGAVLRGAAVDDRVSFADCELVGADLSGASLALTDFAGADLQNARLADATLPSADLAGVNLYGADLTGADLASADLSDAICFDADLSRAVCSHADFAGANLSFADMADAEFHQARLPDANLSDVVAADAAFVEADLTGADLSEADFSGADLFNAALEGTNLTNADLRGATLEDASLIRADLRSADCRNALLYLTHFSDTRINPATRFGDVCAYENPAFAFDRGDAFRLEAAAWTYRRLQALHEANAMVDDARRYHVRRAEALRKRALHRGAYLQWTVYGLNRWLTNHGESPWRVVGVSVAVIAACALAYPLAGIQPAGGGQSVTYLARPAVGALEAFATSAEFSTATFMARGHDALEPVGWGQALATAESFVGALLMALLVFVLGRRTTW